MSGECLILFCITIAAPELGSCVTLLLEGGGWGDASAISGSVSRLIAAIVTSARIYLIRQPLLLLASAGYTQYS